MEFVYALINFLLLVGLVFLLGRKKVTAMFRERRERINGGLDLAEAVDRMPAEPPEEEPLAIVEPERAPEAELTGPIRAAVREHAYRLKAQYDHSCEDMRRVMLLDVRDEVVRRAQKLAAQRMTEEPYRSVLRSHEAEMVDSVLDDICLSPGDMVYLAEHDVLYVTLTASHQMDEELIDRMRERAEQMLAAVNGTVSFWSKVDESLIGGFQLRVGDTVYDRSVANAIVRLGEMLHEQEVADLSADAMLSAMADTVAHLPVEHDEYQVGRVLTVSDGICWLDGVSDIMFGEVVEFACGEQGMVLDIEPNRVGCIIFGRYEHIESLSRVHRLGMMMSVPVGDALLGRVVDALGNPIDGKGHIWTKERRPIECHAPAIPDRKSVSVPLHTGIKPIDALAPIGRGQRELIIGDRQTGKTSIAIDAILNQRGKNVACIYVAIGQKEAAVAEIVAKLQKYGAMEYTTVVCATASDSASMQYIAPFSGAAMSEYFMYNGRDALIVYDDLSKHAVAYRELSLLLHRPSGREAYPGDIFYLHARLLERAAQLSDEAGGGSVTALPIIETQAGDISAYIPTNVISITDGQIFLETDLFNEGQRPAVNVGLSVSRVGGAAQTKLMKQVSSQLRMNLAQYRELATFAQFGSDLDESTQRVLASGARMMAALRQGRYAPLADWQQALLLFAVSGGHASNIEPEQMEAFEERLYTYFEAEQRDLVQRLSTGKKLDAEAIARLRAALTAFTEAA